MTASRTMELSGSATASRKRAAALRTSAWRSMNRSLLIGSGLTWKGSGGQPRKLKHEFVADAVDGQKVFGVVAVIPQLLSQLHNDLVQGAGGAVIAVAPDFIEQTVA